MGSLTAEQQEALERTIEEDFAIPAERQRYESGDEDENRGLRGMGGKLRSLFDRYKFVLVVILAGVVLLLLPSFGGEKRGGGAVESSQESGSDPFQVEELERKLEQALAQIDGVGEVRVVLTYRAARAGFWPRTPRAQ